jgi:Tfp pilus assembly protein PilF
VGAALRKGLWVGIGVAAIVAGGGYVAFTQKSARTTSETGSTATQVAAFIKENESSSSPSVQNSVTKARIQLAYKASENKDFKLARNILVTAAKSHKGSDVINPDYGSLSDQARYQAAVCLVAEGKKEQAQAEFRKIIKDHPKSPIVHAAFKRLVRLNNGTVDPRDQNLLERAIKIQEETIKFELSVCGPKSIAYLLPLLGKPMVDYHVIAKKCGTTNDGTTIEAMRKALSDYGIESYAYRVSRQDLAKIQLPAIWLSGQHYVTLKSISGDSAVVYDSLIGGEREAALPPVDDLNFSANVIVFKPVGVL